MNQTMQVGAPPGTVVERSDSGWMTKELFLVWIKHFHAHVKWSPDKPGLLILDGHYSHTRNLEAIDFARENGIILLSLPPHTTHRLQPLDRTFYQSLMVNYDRVCDKWLRTEKTTVTVDVVARLFGQAYVAPATMSTAVNGFRCTGIWPWDRHVFTDEDCAATSRFGDQLAQAPDRDDQLTQIPDDQLTQIPDDQLAQAPDDQLAQTPDDQLAQAPVDQHTQAPDDQLAQTPDDQLAQTPDDQLAQAHDDQYTQAPDDQLTQAHDDQPSSVITTCADGRCFFRSVVISLDIKLQTATHDHHGNPVDIMSRILETNEADTLRARVIRHMYEHFDDYRNIDEHVANNKHYGSIEDRTEAMASQTEMVGEIEIIATSKCLQRAIEGFVGTWKISADKSALRVQYIASANDAGHYNAIPGNTLITPQILSPVSNFKHQNRRQKTRSEILTASPYKRRLSCSQLGAKKTRQTSAPRVARQSKTKTAPTKTGQSWFCILCGEDRVEDMVRCVNCYTWIHATCAGGIPQTTNAICVSGVFDFHVREQRHVNSGRTDGRATF